MYVCFLIQGLLRIHLMEGQNLVPKDNLMGGMVKGKSDPYVKINIGGETFTSQVIKSNLNPTWNEMYEVNGISLFKKCYSYCWWERVLWHFVALFTPQVILTQLPGQELHVEVFDKDMDMKDDFMGRYISYELFSYQMRWMDSLKIDTNFPYPDMQAEDQSEGHHRFSVHWSGGIFLTKLIVAYLAPVGQNKTQSPPDSLPYLKYNSSGWKGLQHTLIRHWTLSKYICSVFWYIVIIHQLWFLYTASANPRLIMGELFYVRRQTWCC